MAAEKSIRQQYVEHGVENFYREQGASYRNPHFEQLEQLIAQNRHRLDYSNVLDFCCGSGEISLIIKQLGFEVGMATDPFTTEAYWNNTQKVALPLSFEDVMKGELSGNFSCVICSFALHLCPQNQLFPLVWQLFSLSPQLVVLTPHKRPALEIFDSVELSFEDFALTLRGKKVYLKCYQQKFR